MNFIDLINPATLLRSFNTIDGNAAGQEAVLRRQRIEDNALSFNDRVRQFNNSLAFESAARGADAAGFTGANVFGQAALTTNNPFAQLQALEAANSINQVAFQNQAQQRNLALFDSLIGAQGGVSDARAGINLIPPTPATPRSSAATPVVPAVGNHARSVSGRNSVPFSF